MGRKSAGMTLIELLTTLAVIALLMTAATPPLERFFARQNLVSQANRVLGMIHLARADGAYKTPMLLCSSRGRCEDFRGPSPGLILVADRNNNQTLEGDEVVEELSLPEGMTVEWRSFRMKPWLRINRFGVAYYQNGHFLLCYRGQARKVILNYQARARVQREPAEPDRCP